MKKTILFLFVLAVIGLVSLLSRSQGLGFRNFDIRTQSPAHANNCGSCHTGGGAVGGMAIQVFDQTNNAVSSYAANTTYNIVVAMTDINATVGGFQLECLEDGVNTVKVGSFTAGAGTRVTTIGAFEVIEHSTPNAFSNNPPIGNSTGWNFTWTSPATAGSSLTFYASGNAANGNGGTSGDDGYATSTSLTSLPVTFISADVLVYDNQVALFWEAEETTADGKYIIERATGNGDFIMIGEQSVSNVQGESVAYRYTDALPPIGTQLQYRIRQIDTDGAFQSSEVLTTIVSPPENGITKLYPNPPQAGQHINLQVWAPHAGNATVRWLSMDGKGTYSRNQSLEQGENRFAMPNPVKQGSYILEYSFLGKKDSRVVTIR